MGVTQNIEVAFNNTPEGLSRCPTANTRGPVLHLPKTYITYREFKQEFSGILSGESFWLMDSV